MDSPASIRISSSPSPSSPRQTIDTSTNTISTSPPTSTNTHRRASLAELIHDAPPRFDSDAALVRPFNSEMERYASVEQELEERLLRCLMHAHAWASSRPRHETARAADALNDEARAVRDMEQHQELILGRMNKFVMHIQTAIAALKDDPA